MLLTIPAGTTSKIIEFPIFDSSSSTGALLTGLVYNSSGLTAYYDRVGAAGSATSISLVTMTKGTFSSGGFVAVDATNMPGIYQLSIPDAALAASATAVTINLKGGTNMVPVVIVIQLTSVADFPVNVTQLDGASLSTHASGMIPADVRDIAGAAVSATTAQLGVNVVNMNGVSCSGVTTVNANQGTTQPLNFTGTGASAYVKGDMVDIAGAAVSTSSAQIGVNAVQIGAAVPGSATIGTVTTVTNLTNAPSSGDLTSTMKTSVEAAVWNAARSGHTTAGTFGEGAASVQGNVTGSVASVSGAVGSVTGNVGGSVASVTGNVGGNVSGSVASVSGNVGGNVTGSVGSVATGGISSGSFAAGAINDAVLAADIATAGNKIPLACYAALNTAISDATSLNSNGLLDRIRTLGWLQRNKVTIVDASGDTTIYKDDGTTAAFTVSAMLTDSSGTTTRLRAA